MGGPSIRTSVQVLSVGLGSMGRRWRRVACLCLVCLCLVIVAGAAGARVTANPTVAAKKPKLIAEWVFGAKALKRNGLRAKKGPHGRVHGDLEVVGDAEGDALFFDGANDHVVVGDPHTKARKALPAKEFTLEAWVAVNSPQRWGGLISCVSDNGNAEHGWVLGHNEKKFYVGLSTQGANDGDGKLTYLTSKAEFQRGRWHHVAATYDGKKLTLYVDGAVSGESTAQSGRVLYPPATTYALGAYLDRDDRHFFHGRLRRAAVFRTAASADWVRGRFEEQVALTKLKPYLAGAIEVTDLDSREAGIDHAIDRGIEFLLAEIQKMQVGDKGHDAPSQIAFETYALLVAGVPVDHPVISANLEFLKQAIYSRRNTYGVSSYIFALDAGIAQVEYEQALLEPFAADSKYYIRITAPLRAELRKAVETLLRSQQDAGGFRYYPHDKNADNSCTQFAALAMGIGAKRKVPIPFSAWEKLGEYFLDIQQADGKPTDQRVTTEEQARLREALAKAKEGDNGKKGDDEATTPKGKTGVAEKPESYPVPLLGSEELQVLRRGWGYQGPKKSTWNMTCAGVSSLLLVYEQVKERWGATEVSRLRRSLWDGYGFLMENWRLTDSYYAMYSLEKVADLGGVKLFGERDWYDIVVKHLLERQKGDGSWPKGSGHAEKPRIATSFALLILRRATTLVTRDPAEAIIYTGGGRKPEQDDRDWVFVPELETSVNVPSVLRAVQGRPSAKWLGLLASIVRNYEEDYRYEMIAPLLAIQKKAGTRMKERLTTTCLLEITGLALTDPAAYRAWSERATAVVRSGVESDYGAIETNLQYYRETHSLPLKRLIARALVRLSADEAIPVILPDLESDSAEVRQFAYRAIVGLTPSGIPHFDANADDDQRAVQLDEVKRWLARRNSIDG